MDKIIKLNSNEGGPFTATQNRVTFDIPSDGIYDLSESYINLNFQTSHVDADPASGDSVYPIDLRWKAVNDATPAPANPVNPNFPNVCLVKNAVLRTAMQGQLENIRRVDQLNAILAPYTTSLEEEYSKSYHAASQIVPTKNGTQNRFSIYQEINKVGNVDSKVNNNARAMIPLRDLFDFCYQADAYDSSKTGTTSIFCELNYDKLQAVSVQEDFSDLNSFEDITNAGQVSVIKSDIVFDNSDQWPYFVNQKVNCTFTNNGTQQTVKCVIGNIEWIDSGADAGKLNITMKASIFTIPGGQNMTGITLNKVDPQSVSFELNFAEIILTRKADNFSGHMNKNTGKKDPIPSQISYSTFSTEQVNGNAIVPFQRQFQVEPESDAVIISFPQGEDDLISPAQLTNFENFRLRLDNDDLTDRDIEVRSPLYFDRINMTLISMQRRLKRLTQYSGDTAIDAGLCWQAPTQNVSIMNPLVQKANEKLLQVNITGGGSGISRMVLFKHLPRVFSY